MVCSTHDALIECLVRVVVDYSPSDNEFESQNLDALANMCVDTYPQWPRLEAYQPSDAVRYYKTALRNFLRNRWASVCPSTAVVLHPMAAASSLLVDLDKAYTEDHETVVYYAPLNLSASAGQVVNFGPWRIRNFDAEDEARFDFLYNSEKQKTAYMCRKCLWLVGEHKVPVRENCIANAMFTSDLDFGENLTKTPKPYLDEFEEKVILTLLLYPWEELCQNDQSWAPFAPPRFLKHYSNLLQPPPAIRESYHLSFVEEVDDGYYIVDEENAGWRLPSDSGRQLDELWKLVHGTWTCNGVNECSVFRHFFFRAYDDCVNTYLGFDQVLWNLFCIDAVCDRKDQSRKKQKGEFLSKLLTQPDVRDRYMRLMKHRDEYVHGKPCNDYTRKDILEARMLARETVRAFLIYCKANPSDSRDNFINNTK